MCRAVKVLCVAPDRDSSRPEARVVAAEWELSPGATDLREALDQLDAERPHAMVVFGPFEALVALAADRFPACGSSPIVRCRARVRSSRAGCPAALREQPRPGGPVG